MQLKQIVFVPPAPVVAAQHLKAFEREGLDLETTFTRSSYQQRDGLLNGLYDVAVTASDNVFAWNARGGDFCIVAQLERTTLLQIFANASLSALAAQARLRVAVDAPDSGFVLVLRDVLASQGITVQDDQLVPFGGVKERLDGMLRGEADVGLLGPPLDAPALQGGLKLLGTVEQFHPRYPGLGLVVRRSRLDELGTALGAYMRALSVGMRWMASNEREALQAMVGAGFTERAAESVLSTRADTLRPDVQGLELVREIRRKQGALPVGSPEASDLLDMRFVEPIEV